VIDKETREQVFLKCGGFCAYCGQEITLKTMQVDHIRAKRIFNVGPKNDIPDYDVDDMRNLNPSCRQCNNLKHWYTVEQFRDIIETQVKKAMRYSVNFRTAQRFGLIEIKEKPIVFYFEK
jgi:5-methylcytosine-specific restriction endonuclease McrA